MGLGESGFHLSPALPGNRERVARRVGWASGSIKHHPALARTEQRTVSTVVSSSRPIFERRKLMTDVDDWRIDHTGIGMSNIGRSIAFYNAAPGALGLRAATRIARTFEITDSTSDSELGGVGYGATYPIFWIDFFHAHGANQHTAFRARNRQEVQDFHRAALFAGGRDNGRPGLRAGGYSPGSAAAFVLDPDSNNIEAVFREG